MAPLRQRAVLQATFIRVLFPAPVYDGCFIYWRTHCPVEHSSFLKVYVFFLIETLLVSVRANVVGQLLKQVLVNSLTKDVFVRPLGHRLGECPFHGADKLHQGHWKRNYLTH